MRRQLIIVMVFYFFIMQKAAGEQITLGLSECLKLGSRNNLLMGLSYNELKYFEARYKEARALHIPSFNFDTILGPSADSKWIHWGVIMAIELTGYIPLITFGKIYNVEKMAQTGIQIGKQKIRLKAAEIQYDIVKVYLGLLLSKRIMDVVEYGRNLLQKKIKQVIAGLKLKDGRYSVVDKFKLILHQSEIDRMYFELEKSIRLATQFLQFLLGISDRQTLQIKSESFPSAVLKLSRLSQYLENSKKDRLDLKLIDLGIKVTQFELGANKAQNYPTFYLAGKLDYVLSSLQLGGYDVKGVPDTDLGVSGYGGIGFSLNLNFYQTYLKVQQSKIQLDTAVSQKNLLLHGVKLEVKKAYENAENALKILKTLNRGAKAARKWLTYSIIKNTAVIDVDELIKSLVAYSKGKIEYYKGQRDYFLAFAELIWSTGGDFQEISPYFN